MGKNLEEAHRLAARLREVEEKQKRVRERGWNILRTFWPNRSIAEAEEYESLFDKLLASEEVVDTGDVQILLSNRFAVDPGWLTVDCKAPPRGDHRLSQGVGGRYIPNAETAEQTSGLRLSNVCTADFL